MSFSKAGIRLFAFFGRFSADFSWTNVYKNRQRIDRESTENRRKIDAKSTQNRRKIDAKSTQDRRKIWSIFCPFSVDLLSVFCRSSVDFGRNWPKPSLSGVVNPGLQIAFQKRGQKRPKIVLKQGPQRVCTIHPDLPAGTPCYNFTGPTRNTV
jgi:hypothetical protein